MGVYMHALVNGRPLDLISKPFNFATYRRLDMGEKKRNHAKITNVFLTAASDYDSPQGLEWSPVMTSHWYDFLVLQITIRCHGLYSP